MKISHKIIAVLNLLILAGIVFLFINPSFVLANVNITLATALALLVILIPFFWGIINYVGYLGGYPVAIDELPTFEKALAISPLINFIIVASIVFILFMFS